MILLALLVGCAGPSEETLIDELRVVGVVPDPPEAVPGADVAIEVVFADPDASGADVLVWLCTPSDGGCAEADRPIPEWTRIGATVTLPAPDASTSIGALVCAPGLCPLIDDVAAATGPDAALAADLADPDRWLVDLPFRGVSLATKALGVSESPSNANPVLEPRFDAVTAAPGDEVRLGFTVIDDDLVGARSFAYTTAGGFEGTSRDADEGVVRWTWFAPAAPGVVDLYVAVDDASGGTAVWHGTATVR